MKKISYTPIDAQSVIPPSWTELLPRQKSTVYQFVSDVLTISKIEAKELCNKNQDDSAFIGNSISEQFKAISSSNFGENTQVNRKWRNNFPSAIPPHDWSVSADSTEINQISIQRSCSLSAYSDVSVGLISKKLPEHVDVHRAIHKRLLEGIPNKFQKKYGSIINWLDGYNFKSLDENPFMETGSIWQNVFSAETYFKLRLQIKDIEHAQGSTIKKINETINHCRSVLCADIFLIPLLEELEEKLRQERNELRNLIRKEIVNDLNNCLSYDAHYNLEEASQKTHLKREKENEILSDEQQPGYLLAQILCELTINRCLLEHNTMLIILENVEEIAVPFFDWWWQVSRQQTLEKDDVMSHQGRRAVFEKHFGIDSVFGQQNPTQAIRPELIDCLLRIGENLEFRKHLGETDAPENQETLQAAKLWTLLACYFSEAKVKSDRHLKSVVRILPGKTSGNLDNWAPSAEARMLMLEMTQIFKYHIVTNNFSERSISTSVGTRKDKILHIQNFIFDIFKGKSPEFQYGHMKLWSAYAENYAETLEPNLREAFQEDDAASRSYTALFHNFEEVAKDIIQKNNES